nr:alpha-L-arabinofuranosidase C-terminal domain-containing protein [Microlunatus panaciterrae]
MVQTRFAGQESLQIREAGALIEDVYDVQDAVVVGSLLITFMRHTDWVPLACQAQLVNVIAPILTKPGRAAWRQTIFHPFASPPGTPPARCSTQRRPDRRRR